MYTTLPESGIGSRNRSFLLAAIDFGRDGEGLPPFPADARIIRHTVRTQRLFAELAFSPDMVRAERNGSSFVLVHGEIYDEPESTFANRLLDACEAGSDLAPLLRERHGSFACIVVDGSRDTLIVVTDHINSRKLFWSRHGQRYWISSLSGFGHHPVAASDLDEAGVASALVNGIPINGRTVFSAVRIADRASVHTVDANGWRNDRYWELGFDPGRRPEKALRDELAHLTLAAVGRRTRPDESLFVSLSGGYDSTALIAALVENGVRDATCLSYTKLSGSNQPDVLVARETARMAEFPHRVVEGFKLPLLDVLRDNVRLGQSNARLVAGTDAWREIGSILRAASPASLLVGDETLGFESGDPRSSTDVLHALAFADWSGVPWLASRLPQRTNRLLADSLLSDLQEIVARAPAGESYQDTTDWIYLDQRLPRLLAWREAFASHSASVRQPLLDCEILNFMQQVPPELRKDKRLFCEAITERYPRWFASPRPAGGWEIRAWARRVVQREWKTIEELLSNGPNPLDEWIPPAVLRDLLARQLRSPAATLPGRTAQRVRRHVGRALAPRFVRVRRPRVRSVDECVLLLRAIHLRAVVQERLSASP